MTLPAGAGAQESLLERWAVTYVSEGWAPRWLDAHGGWPASSDGPRLRVVLTAEALSFGRALGQRVRRVDVAARHPSGGPASMIATASSGSWRSTTKGRVLMETPRSEAAAAGAVVRDALPAVGALSAAALAGWDGGPGAWFGIAAEGPHHTLSASGWTTRARRWRLLLPADSLRDIGGAHVARGVRLDGEVVVPLGPVRVRPSASWRSERFSHDPPLSSFAFLTTSPRGRADDTTFGLAVGTARFGVAARHRTRDTDVDSTTLVRSGQSAGQIFFARSALEVSAAESWARLGERLWSMSAGWERLRGELATRVETWPFADLWGVLSAQAYRLNGDLEGEALTWVLRSEPTGPGWVWGVDVGRYEVHAARESWFVTSFGFGRRDEQTSSDGADPAYVVGAEVGRVVTVRGGTLDVRVSAGLPVHARGVDGGDAGGGGDDLAGYAAVRVSWSR